MNETDSIYNRIMEMRNGGGGQGNQQMDYLRQLLEMNPNNPQIQQLVISKMMSSLDPANQYETTQNNLTVSGYGDQKINDTYGMLMDAVDKATAMGDMANAAKYMKMVDALISQRGSELGLGGEESGYMGIPGLQLDANGYAVSTNPAATDPSNVYYDAVRQNTTGKINDMINSGEMDKEEFDWLNYLVNATNQQAGAYEEGTKFFPALWENIRNPFNPAMNPFDKRAWSLETRGRSDAGYTGY